jgi:rhodanese-related sulfurtransferase
MLLPMSELLARIDEVPTDAPLAILCRSGNRSGRVADHLNADGDFGDVANIEGGIIAWAAEGLPYEGDTPR